MSEKQWHINNERYMAAAVKWIRLCLEAQIHRILGSRPLHQNGIADNASPAQHLDSAIAEAAREMAEIESMDPPPAMTILCGRLRLSDFERSVLLLCTAMELDTQIPAMCGRAQDDVGRPFPTFALAMSLFDNAHWDALSPQGPLRFWRLIEVGMNSGRPLTASPLFPDERIVNFLKGLNQLDERLAVLLSPVFFEEEALPPSQKQTVAEMVQLFQGTNGNRHQGAVQLIGPDEHSKRTIAARAATQLGKILYRLPVSALPTQPSELEQLICLWQRETLLLPLVLYVDAGGDGIEGQLSFLRRFLERCSGLCFVSIREAQGDLSENTISFDIKKPTPAEQQKTWRDALSGVKGARPEILAAQFNLNTSVIRTVAAEALADPEADIQERLWRACLVRSRPSLDHLAQRIDIKATWDDIVLPNDEMTLLRQIASQVHYRMKVYDQWGFREKLNRGLGISALFAGESGTGKTMAAEVLANHLGLNLYRIDLSAVVSKYIGETEKNLRRLFDAAEDGGAILFFDEADALFGKRSEVKDSHDRYANIEINYLLQRMEAYRGLAVLATNMKTAMDQAFMRRLRFVVNFSFPDVNQRKAIWEKVFPSALPKTPLDLKTLARLSITGGAIHNIAINAAFLAAEHDVDVDMSHILTAARIEYRKMGRPVNETEFRGQPRRGRRI
jgi:hypothetical protein